MEAERVRPGFTITTRNHPTGFFRPDLGAEAGRLIDASFAQNTLDTYRTGLQWFENFRAQHRLPLLWPHPVPHVMLFIAFLSLNNKSSKTAACYITAINFRCKFYQNVDISQNFIAKKMLQGMKRSKRSKDVKALLHGKACIAILVSCNVLYHDPCQFTH